MAISKDFIFELSIYFFYFFKTDAPLLFEVAVAHLYVVRH
jgi:hypothetical protein